MSKLVGIDYGTKRVGIAVTDESGSVAFPKTVFPNDSNLLSKVVKLMKEEAASVAVMGESKNATGAANAVLADAKRFAEELKQSGATVVYEPEFYSSVEARRDTEKTHVDAQAAAIILNSYISRSKS